RVRDDDEDAAARGALGERRGGGLRRGHLIDAQRLDDVDATRAGAVGQGALERRGNHLLRGRLRVVARLRAVDRAAATVLRHADRALAGATGALLLEGLRARAGDLAARLRLVRALAGGGKLRGDDLVDEGDVRL